MLCYAPVGGRRGTQQSIDPVPRAHRSMLSRLISRLTGSKRAPDNPTDPKTSAPKPALDLKTRVRILLGELAEATLYSWVRDKQN